MKTSIAAILALFLAGVPFAGAQEDEPSPSPSETAESTTTDESPSPEPSVTVGSEKPASSPTPTAASSPMPKPGDSPAGAAKPAASPAAPGRKMSVEATLRDMENKWSAAIQKKDASVMQSFLADDYIGVSSKGKILNKRALLAEIKKDKDTYTSAKNGRMDVRIFGNTAVVIGTSTEKGKDKDGKAFNRTYRWTDTWVARNGRWQCVASQSLLMPR